MFGLIGFSKRTEEVSLQPSILKTLSVVFMFGFEYHFLLSMFYLLCQGII